METKENVANMLPIVPLSGTTISKEKSKNQIDDDDDCIDDIDDDLVVSESFIANAEDIFYNKKKFDKGEINVCFITGYSGGGKSTMSKSEKGFNKIVIDMDKIILGMHKSIEYFKSLGNFQYNFVTGPGKKYMFKSSNDNVAAVKEYSYLYRRECSVDLIKYTINFANQHRHKKIILEGVWIYRYIEPQDIDKYAVYIKGTSLKQSTDRAIARDTKNSNVVGKKAYGLLKYFNASKDALFAHLEKFQRYFGNLYRKQLEEETSSYSKIKKSVKNNIHDIKEKIKLKKESGEIQILSESVFDYIENDEVMAMNQYIEESMKDFILNYKTKNEIPRKVRSLTTDIAIMKVKLKFMDKSDTKKVNELKREIIRKEQEKRKYSSDLTNDAKSEVKKMEKEAEKIAIKEYDDVTTDEDKDIDNDVKDTDKDIEKDVKFKDKEVKESADEEELPTELKRIDEVRGKLEDLKKKFVENTEKLRETGEDVYEKKIKGLGSQIKSTEEKLKSLEDDIKKYNENKKKEKEVEESYEDNFNEAAEMEDEIKPIVNKLNKLGYKVKYASPGHTNLRKKEDQEPDGVYYDKLYSDARIMFKDKYNFPLAPKYWHWREVDKCSYLDITPLKFNKEGGTPNEQFKKWKTNYMNSLKKFVDELEPNKSNDDMTIESLITDSRIKFGLEDLVTEGFFNFKNSESEERLKRYKVSGKSKGNINNESI